MRLAICLLVLCFASVVVASNLASAQDQPSWVPPYPGPAPTSWPSVVHYEQYASVRAEQLKTREVALIRAGRTPHYHLKRSALFTAMALGMGMAVGGWSMHWTRNGEDDRGSSTYSRVATGLMIGGAAFALATGLGARTLKKRNLYNDEIEQLGQERTYWTREVRRVRRDQKRLQLSYLGLAVVGTF